MGNNACCSDSRAHEKENQRVDIDQTPGLQLPNLNKDAATNARSNSLPEITPEVDLLLKEKKYLQAELSQLKKPEVLVGEQQTYFGELDEKKLPKGCGKVYKKNGSVYVGNFKDGKAEGLGLFVFADGSYYEGEMVDNMAESPKGYYKNNSFQYVGGFHHNKFHGAGREKGISHDFQGEFENGGRKHGVLKWTDSDKAYCYIGSFDKNGKFTGKGKLQDPLGTYQGYFKEGLKQGFGVYHFKSKIRYEGYYKNDMKNGRGTIINLDGTVAFCGEFLQGLPHGKGYATDKKGVKHSLQWNRGVYADL